MPGYMYMDGLEEYESYIEVVDVHVQMKNLGSEKQISVDPISLRDSVSSSSSSGNKAKELDIFHLKPPSKPKFLSYSLPNSATSSPKFGSAGMSKKKAKNLNQDPILTVNPFYRQNSVALTNLERLREIHLRRSKSCGDGRASIPPEEFDLWPMKNANNNHYIEGEGKVKESKQNETETMETYDEKFKCGALCLFLPGLGKAKPIKPRKEEPETEPEVEAETGGLHVVVSKRVSLEKFECGSWRSSAILEDAEADNKDVSSNLFYELPLEMIRCSGSTDDTHSPVTSAFVFDKDRKGVLKKSSSRTTTPKKSPDSSRHVRFSTSSPKSHPASPTSSSSCVSVTPRLLKARDDFNAFLEAQAA